MKIFYFLLLLSAQNVFAQKVDIVNVRNLFSHSAQKEEAVEKLLNLLESVNDNEPLLYGYKGVANIMLSKYKTFPWTKWEYFKKGKKMLEKAINKAPTNYELHYLRYAIQSCLPDFLGYNVNLKQDKKILMNGYEKLKDTDLKKRVVKILRYNSIEIAENTR